MANYGSVAQGPPPMAEPSYRGEVPHEDVDENSARREAPSAPSAPPPGQIGHIGGYESVQYNESNLMASSHTVCFIQYMSSFSY